MTLYHASTSPFKDGEILTSPKPGSFYPEVLDVLEAGRPSGAPSRSACFFAGRTAEFAVMHLQAELDKVRNSTAEIHLFEVEMPDGWGAPMAIIHQIAKGLKSVQDVRTLINEYWKPTKSWYCMEVFGSEMTILCEAALPAPSYTARIEYEADFKRAQELLQACPPA